jgi:hypothetical protein
MKLTFFGGNFRRTFQKTRKTHIAGMSIVIDAKAGRYEDFTFGYVSKRALFFPLDEGRSAGFH